MRRLPKGRFFAGERSEFAHLDDAARTAAAIAASGGWRGGFITTNEEKRNRQGGKKWYVPGFHNGYGQATRLFRAFSRKIRN
jgi:hypothetical protein